VISTIRLIICLPEDRASVPIIWYQIVRFTARFYHILPLVFILCSSPTVHKKKAKNNSLIFRCPTTTLCLCNTVFSFALLSLYPWSSFCCWSRVVFLVLVQSSTLCFCAVIPFPPPQQQIEPSHYSICLTICLVFTPATLSPR
jgi:hypothetical protein